MDGVNLQESEVVGRGLMLPMGGLNFTGAPAHSTEQQRDSHNVEQIVEPGPLTQPTDALEVIQ